MRAQTRLATLLLRTPLFRGLAAPHLAQIVAATREQRHARGAMIFQKGDYPATLLVVATGKLKEACQSPTGAERIIEVLGPARLCGEAAIFLDHPLPFSVTALTNTLLLHIDKATLRAVADNDPAFVKGMVMALSQRVVALLCDIEAFTSHSPLRRIAGYLIENSPTHPEGMPTVVLPTAKQVIASRLGMSPEALSRAFRDLAEAGIIEVRGSRVAVRDMPRLQECRQ